MKKIIPPLSGQAIRDAVKKMLMPRAVLDILAQVHLKASTKEKPF